jgi:hypothetical protein
MVDMFGYPVPGFGFKIKAAYMSAQIHIVGRIVDEIYWHCDKVHCMARIRAFLRVIRHNKKAPTIKMARG